MRIIQRSEKFTNITDSDHINYCTEADKMSAKKSNCNKDNAVDTHLIKAEADTDFTAYRHIH